MGCPWVGEFVGFIYNNIYNVFQPNIISVNPNTLIPLVFIILFVTVEWSLPVCASQQYGRKLRVSEACGGKVVS